MTWFGHAKSQQAAAGDCAADGDERHLPGDVVDHGSKQWGKQKRNRVADGHGTQILRVFFSGNKFQRVIGNGLHGDGRDTKKDVRDPKPLTTKWKPRRGQQHGDQWCERGKKGGDAKS